MTDPVLVLWDIDHTLIDSGGMSFALYRRAFRTATGRELAPVELFSGRTDLDVMHETLRASGLDPTPTRLRAIASALSRVYEDAADELTEDGRVLPGVVATLDRLAREPGVHQGVLTGNLRQVARVKLTAFGIDGRVDLASSAFGDDHLERADLVPIAQRAASARTGHSYGGARTVLIGDTPNDVAAAEKAGVRVIAVATGRTDADGLRAAGAAHVVDDLTDSDLIASLVLASTVHGS